MKTIFYYMPLIVVQWEELQTNPELHLVDLFIVGVCRSSETLLGKLYD